MYSLGRALRAGLSSLRDRARSGLAALRFNPSRVEPQPYMHINWAREDAKSITAVHCPDCKKRTRMLGIFQEWYGWRETCLRCGRSWEDGEWLPLEFVRGSRQKAIAAAKKRWRRSPDAKVIRRVVTP
jgi:hypothetical protein